MSTDMMTNVCDRCQNNSTCQIITDLQSGVSNVHCACSQGWLGDRCQIRVRLLLVSVTMTTATLQWEAQITDTQNTDLDKLFVSNLEIVPNFTDSQRDVELKQAQSGHSKSYSEGNEAFSLLTQNEFIVNYWTKSRRKECNIVPNLTRTVFTISGLDKETEYTFCAKTDHAYTCDFDLVNHFDDVIPACVSVTTKTDEKSAKTAYLVILICVAAVGLIALVIVCIISKRNNYFSFLICAKENRSHRQTGSVSQRSNCRSVDFTEDSRPEIYLLKSQKTNNTISISPPNCPGKPKYKIKKRVRGYAAFSAQNEQTIPLSTVLEYSERDLEEEIDDTDNDSDIVVENGTDDSRNVH